MALTVGQFQESLKKPLRKLSRKELQDEAEMFRALWGWTDETVRRFLFRVGTQVRFMRRDYKGTTGELGEIKFEPLQIEIATYEKSYDYATGKWVFERKLVIYPWNSVAWMEEIYESIDAEEVEVPTLSELPVEEAIS